MRRRVHKQHVQWREQLEERRQVQWRELWWVQQ
jgi:hypothetical protein